MATIPVAENVTLTIYNTLGEIVRQFNDNFSAGLHTIIWNGNDIKADELNCGTYYLKMQAGKYIGVKKLVIFE
ncbi:MAG: T9SS type A sorting domain-containing protein [Bacteroidia bacterium]|nr:T9SS type A sorting domain-containing protein [Bacteroidia bacterium]